MKHLKNTIYHLPFTKCHLLNKIKNRISYMVYGISQSGFTLVEVLIVLMILLVIGSIIGTILSSSLRGTNKTNTLSVIRQNGNYAITQISKILRNAAVYNGLSIDSVLYAPNCQVFPPSPTPPPVFTKYNYLKITTADNEEIIFFCDSTGKNILQNGNSLVAKNAVSVLACSFTCTKNNVLDTPTINIALTLSQSGEGKFVESSGIVSFDTSITIRNFQR